ncbi:MAG TPA: Ig-like domain-containing protein, partial [Thermoanaerobaculia bacterium]
MKTMKSVKRSLLVFLLALMTPALGFGHGVTLTGTILFSSLDGSAEDHDGAVNGVFTVNDGNLVIQGTVQCNDDPPLPLNASACPIAMSVSGNLTVEAGGAIFAENRRGGGTGGSISLTVGGNLTLRGPSGALPGAVVSSSRLTDSVASSGQITFSVDGNVVLEAGSTVAASTLNGTSGIIGITADGTVMAAGLVASGPSRQVLGTKLTGKVLNGGSSNQVGGAILIRAHSSTGPGIRVEGDGIIVSQGEKSGSQLVQLEACGIEIRGLIASVSKTDGASQVVLRSGKGLLVDGQDLGSAGPNPGRLGRLRADGVEGGSTGYRVDLFAADDVQVLGPNPAGSLFAVTSSPGTSAQRTGGIIRAISLAGALSAAGNAFEAGKTNTGNQGGTIDLKAKGNVTLDGATLRAVGDYTTSSPSRKGGSISARSYQGELSWTFGVGDVRPTGTGVSPPSRRGSITLTACSGIDTTGTQFPVVGSPVLPFPTETNGVCSPSAPSLPSGEPALPVCDQPPVAVDDAATADEDSTNNPIDVLANDTDPDGGTKLVQSVTQPANGTVAITGGGTGVTYTPNANYCNTPPGTTLDTFTYTLNGGSTATVTVTVTCFDDNPTAVNDTATVAEDSGATTINVLANDTDPDGGTKLITAVQNPSANGGTVLITNAGADLTYQPAANYCNNPPGSAPDTFTYTITGGSTA